MNLLERINIYEQETQNLKKGETKVDLEFNFDEALFDKMANFIINLEPDKLTDEQLEKVINMIEDLEPDLEEVQEQEQQQQKKRRRAKKSTGLEKSYGRKWYRMNKVNVKKRKKKFMRSAEGRKRMRLKDRMARIGRTPTGRKKLSYNVSKKEDRE
jgi:hypothetical protein